MAEPKENDKTEVADSDTLKIRLEEAKSSAPVLVVISGKPLGKSFYLTKESIVLGRDLIREEFHRSLSKTLPLTLLMFDIDHFKQTNDTFGHLAGDYVLKETCNLIKTRMIRQKDSLGRYGGEEFALVLRETPLRIGV